MTLTRSHGPLSADPAPGNYRIDGPAHRLYFQAFPRRVRAVLGGETVLDSRRGALLHETGLLPQLYVPEADVRAELLTPTAHTTHCPFKGDASYRTVRAGERTAENAVWTYTEPMQQADWLRGYCAVYWASMDTWLDEDEPVAGHLRDPYHRIDIRPTSSRVRVLAGDLVIAQSERAHVLCETGLPNRYYLPRDAVRADLLVPSDTATMCPYKGAASYWSVRAGDEVLADAAWCYAKPCDEALRIRDQLCLAHPGITVEVDGEPVDQSMPR